MESVESEAWVLLEGGYQGDIPKLRAVLLLGT